MLPGEERFIKDKTKGLWILKPTSLYGGEGIRIIRNITSFKEKYITDKEKAD